MQTNGEFLESLRPAFNALFGEDGYLLSFTLGAIALMIFYSIGSLLFRLLLRHFFWRRRGESGDEQNEDCGEEQCYEEDEEEHRYD